MKCGPPVELPPIAMVWRQAPFRKGDQSQAKQGTSSEEGGLTGFPLESAWNRGGLLPL